MSQNTWRTYETNLVIAAWVPVPRRAKRGPPGMTGEVITHPWRAGFFSGL
jgi:hypothetical protein